MSVPVSQRLSAPELVQGHFEGVKSKTRNLYQALPAPFFDRKAVLLLGDAFLVVLAVLTANLLWRQAHNAESGVFTSIRPSWYWFVVLFGCWWVVAWLNDLYHIPSSFDKKANAVRVASVGMMNLIVCFAVYFMIPNQIPWAFYLYLLAIVWPAIALWRLLYATTLVQPNFQRRALIVGTGRTARTITQAIEEHDPCCEIVGYLACDTPKQERDAKGVSMLTEWDTLTSFVQDHGVSDIILARPSGMYDDQLRAVLKCFELGVRIVPMPELFEEITGRIPVEHIDERWLVFLPIGWDSRGLYPMIKRAMDIVVGGIGLLLLMPFFPFLALAIKLDSPGPVFYRVERLGQAGKPFHIWKFRTMVANADSIGDPTFTAQNDDRITRLGRILRRFHVDELPQFLNILAGDMSVVGPRPERYVPELEESVPYYRTRYAAKPGATGWALVHQGYAEGVGGTLIKLQYDLYYVKHQSLSLDILILYKSMIHMLTMRGQ